MQRQFIRSLIISGALAALVVALVACTSSAEHAGTGIVTGFAPLCYGPGPGMNLKPITVLHAVRTDGLARTVKVRTANDHNAYRLRLPAGTYRISTYSGHIRVTVSAGGVTRHADLPQPGCL